MSNPSIEVIRHSTAHLLAQAIKELYPESKFAVGPVVENGFYYDIELENHAFSEEDFPVIEKKMHELIKKAIPITREEVSRQDAQKYFTEKGEVYKLVLLDHIPDEEKITFYRQGDFVDMCRGPHVANTKELGAFKLTKVSGAYFLGDANNKMLQRIYGVAFATKAELDEYLNAIAEAEKRDHRKLGKAMDLFHFQEEAPGMVFWHQKGMTIRENILKYLRGMLHKKGYEEVSAPLILDRSLWEKSGHWDKFGAKNMFVTETEGRAYAIKPMNCPGHIQIYKQKLHSYRDLPIYLGEFGMCHRNEPSGTLHGLMRLRQFTQDDAHIFCTPEQLADELQKLIDIVYKIYADFGFTDVAVKVATRPEKSIGSIENWNLAEKALKEALTAHNISFTIAEGEGAFYGPKIEFHLKDSLKRTWQCGTIQVDFSMPGRLGAEYIDADGSKKNPIMIHRAILGSIDRFIAILLENYAGFLPMWLAPVHLALLSITEEQTAYINALYEKLDTQDFRVIKDLRNEKIGYKVREHTMAKVPYLAIIGRNEVESNTVSLRKASGENLGTISIDDLISLLQKKTKSPIFV